MRNKAYLPSREDHDVGRKLAAVLEDDAIFFEVRYLAVILQTNLPVDDQLACSDVLQSYEKRSPKTISLRK